MEDDDVALFLHLKNSSYRFAAAGLLRDLFFGLRRMENIPADEWAKVCKDTPNEVSVNYREILMEILGDDDGRRLKHWLELFKSSEDQNAGVETYASEFEMKALEFIDD